MTQHVAASVESRICARKAWAQGFRKLALRTNVCFHLLSQATLKALLQKCLRDGMQGNAGGTSHWNKLAFLQHIKWIQVTYLLRGRMKVFHLISIRPMECWLATLHISCDNVTCFGTNKCCSNRSHLPESVIKALCFLLALSLWMAALIWLENESKSVRETANTWGFTKWPCKFDSQKTS